MKLIKWERKCLQHKNNILSSIYKHEIKCLLEKKKTKKKQPSLFSGHAACFYLFYKVSMGIRESFAHAEITWKFTFVTGIQAERPLQVFPLKHKTYNCTL